MKLNELIETCVTEISTESSPVYFLFASWVETCNELIRKGNSDAYYSKLYPLVLLHNSFEESNHIYGSEVDECKIYIIAQSELDYSTEQRRELVYDAVLQPIFDNLIRSMNLGHKFHKSKTNRLQYSKKDLYKLFVGDKQNKLPDHLEAIEITFQNLVYYNT